MKKTFRFFPPLPAIPSARAVLANRPAAGAEPARLVTLRCLGDLRPRFGLRVVRQRQPQRVLLLVVAAVRADRRRGRAHHRGSTGVLLRPGARLAPQPGPRVVPEHPQHRQLPWRDARVCHRRRDAARRRRGVVPALRRQVCSNDRPGEMATTMAIS
jgi:hypothetical protein